MSVLRSVLPALAAVLLNALTTGNAGAVERWHPNVPYGNRMKTPAFTGPEKAGASPYDAALHNVILDEIRQTETPFVLKARTKVLVRFDIDRRGKLLNARVVQGAGSKVADDHLEQIVRRASRRFPPCPADYHPGESLTFVIPISFR